MTKTKRPKDPHALSFGPNLIINLLIGVFALLCVLPFILVVMISFTDEKTLLLNGYRLFPEKFSLAAYAYIFQAGDQLLHSYGITIFITIVGTILSVLITGLYAYALSRDSFKYRKLFNFLAFFTMLFGGGLVPTYIVCTNILHLRDSIWALILPMILNPFFIIVLRTFFKTSIPDSVVESAYIDGAGEWRIFFQIVFPLSLPGLATIGLFSALGFWNDWFNALLYIDNPKLIPLQYLLMRIENSMDFLIQNATKLSSSQSATILQSLPRETTRMAMVVLATVPIALAYPFFQKYFVQGLTIGAVKE
ncbi:MAG: carbohydrate ABC transporter permease [Epulopiscium sp.]|nr:carbohydrate ABC transporter permease [Candidatus Epulonipiscium sp.]